MIEYEILAGAVVFIAFLVAVIHQQNLITKVVRQNKEFVTLCAEQNRSYLESADLRLSKANEMVLECTKSVEVLAQSADKLAVTITEMKDIISNLREQDEKIREEIRANRDELLSAYTKLLHEFESLDREYKDELKLLANKSTISNYNIPEQTKLT